MSAKIIFIIGAGGGVGAEVAARFAKGGYKVAIASRSLEQGTSPLGYLTIKLDASDPRGIMTAFNVVRTELGTPSVVVYNAYSSVPAEEPFDTDLAPSLAVNVVSAHATAREFIRDFKKGIGHDCTYIFTGNSMNDHRVAIPEESLGRFYALALGKSAASHIIRTGAGVYGPRGARFYYVDERSASGGAMHDAIDCAAHAEEYWMLADQRHQSECLHTFVKGKGYQAF